MLPLFIYLFLPEGLYNWYYYYLVDNHLSNTFYRHSVIFFRFQSNRIKLTIFLDAVTGDCIFPIMRKNFFPLSSLVPGIF